MNRILIAICVMLMAFAAHGGEKDSQPPRANGPIVVPSAATVTGSLSGAPTYTRIFGGVYDGTCGISNSLSSSGVGVPYAVIPFHTTNPAGEVLIVSLDNPGTDITDTTLSIYCAFDPGDATTGLYAYNDDASGLLSGFDAGDGVMLAPGTTYYAVLSTFDPGTVGGGNYEITFGGDVVTGSGTVAAFQPVPGLNLAGLLVLALLALGLGMVVLRRSRARHN